PDVPDGNELWGPCAGARSCVCLMVPRKIGNALATSPPTVACELEARGRVDSARGTPTSPLSDPDPSAQLMAAPTATASIAPAERNDARLDLCIVSPPGTSTDEAHD